MFRLCVGLSVGLHLLLLGIVSMLNVYAPSKDVSVEKRFRVNVRKELTPQAGTVPTPVFPPALETSSFDEQHPTPADQETVVAIHETPTPIPSPEFKPNPTVKPTPVPTAIPTAKPVPIPTTKPTPVPTPIPTPVPTPTPTPVPTSIPTLKPTPVPTLVSNSPPKPGSQTQPLNTPAEPVSTATIPLAISSPTTSDSESVLPQTGIADVSPTPTPGLRDKNDHTATQQEKLVLQAYLQEVAQKINTAKHYPRRARRKGWEGTVVLTLRILPTGEVQHSEVSTPSAYPVLDDAALQAIADAQPFPRFPEQLALQALTVNIPIRFTLEQ